MRSFLEPEKVVTWLLAAAFASAAIFKLKSFSTLKEYLEIGFGRRISKLAAFVLVLYELLTSSMLIIRPFGLGGGLMMASSLIVAGSAFLAFRLNLTEDTKCACWGQSTRILMEGHADWIRPLRPAMQAFRNGTLLLLAWVAEIARAGQSARIGTAVAIFLVCPLVLVIGLFASIVKLKTSSIRERRQGLSHTLPLAEDVL